MKDGEQNKKRTATLADIASLTGVSAGTVSRILSGNAGKIRISQATCERVLEAANSLGYQRNFLASALREKSSNVIGLIIRDIDDPLLRMLAKEIQTAAHNIGLDVLIGNADYSSSYATRQLEFMLNGLFDGLILLGNLPNDEEIKKRLQTSGKPCVAIACSDSLLLPSIGVDNSRGATLALDHLLSKGHKDIAFIGDSTMAGVDVRFNIWQEYISKGKINHHDNWNIEMSNERLSNSKPLADLIRSSYKPTAFFCASDVIALNVINILSCCNYSIPDDFSIVSFDNIPESHLSKPKLTTVSQPVKLMAEKAIKLVEEKNFKSGVYLFEPELMARETTKIIKK